MSALNASGRETLAGVAYLTILSDGRDKYFQPTGRFFGAPNLNTGIGPESAGLEGATNIVIAGADHREVALSQQAFSAMYQFITGEAARRFDAICKAEVVLSGRVVGYSGAHVSNRGTSFPHGSKVFAQDAKDGQRQGKPLLDAVLDFGGARGPIRVGSETPL